MADYTDIVARFTDGLAAETFAKFISDAGISCDVVERRDVLAPMPDSYGVRVARDRVEELKKALDLKPVEKGLTQVAAQLMAGRLARENIPCYVGGWHNFGYWGQSGLQLDAVTTLKETNEQGYMVAVPKSLFEAATRVLNQTPISDEELTELALRTPPDPNDPT